ncbi:MAG: hypothetical protein JSR66_24980 [Proteobacteria bacterium]|nr:hypothetical protein [Pseudomonadota bacterium]
MRVWTPGTSPPSLHVIKPVYSDKMPALSRARLLENAVAQRETVLLFDTNILRRMYDFARAGARREALREHGLDQLIRVLNQPDYDTLLLSPGFAFDELAPAMTARFHSVFEWFISHYTPQYRNHPSALPPNLWTPQYHSTYWELTRHAQYVFALPYALLLLLQAVIGDKSGQGTGARFERFIQLVLAEIDMLSAREIEVARWCLSPPIDRDISYRDRRQAMIDNFAKFQKRTPRSIEELKHTALNGARDLLLIAAAVYSDAKGLDGIAQDTWIATYDGKLASYCEHFSYVPLGPLSGSLASITHVPSDHDTGYWQSTAELLYGLNRQRAARALSREFNAPEIVERVRRAEGIVEMTAAHRFG